MSTEANSPQTLLEKRPEARTFSIQDLLDEVKIGKVRVPIFQRDLKWKREDAKALLDSLYRGYPVGTLLFWEKRAERELLEFGTLQIHAAERSDAFFVVDGQQRISALARTLLVPATSPSDFSLSFDLEKQEFVIPPAKNKQQTESARWLPMTEVLDAEKLMTWIMENISKDDTVKRAIALQLGKRIREYQIPTYIVKTENETILRDIFHRINSAGKPLEKSEVFDALNGKRSNAAPSSIKEIADKLEHIGFGRVDEKIIYNLIVLIQEDKNFILGKQPEKLEVRAAEILYRQVAEITESVIYFLKKEAEIPSYHLLPYKPPMITLAKFLQNYPNPSPRSKQLIKRWLWRGMLNKTLRGDGVSSRTGLLAVVPNNEEQSVANMLDIVNARMINPPSINSAFRFRFAESKFIALALLDLQPKDFFSGEPLHIDNYLHKQAEKMVTKIISSNLDKELMQSGANRLIYPRSYLNGNNIVPLILESEDEAILLSHGITLEAQQLLREGKYAEFINKRAEYLQPKVDTFFAAKARWDENDRPAISALFVGDND